MEQMTQKSNSSKSLWGKTKLFFKTRFAGNDFFLNHIVLWLLLFGIITNAADWTILLVFMNRLDADVILHYNVYFGVDMLGNWKLAFMMPAVGLVLFLVNAFLADYFYRNKERIASYILLLAALMVQLSLIVASAAVIMINY
ncbi:MAG: hypothetical protein P4L62_03755 [Candidatus Pacebacteria bacterium]|nr:hypothetical protein [Candidatus Paceibacterota bacterium]MDR3583447.1 hypothetical protein [Candidatus Paceibacterota bacterium]